MLYATKRGNRAVKCAVASLGSCCFVVDHRSADRLQMAFAQRRSLRDLDLYDGKADGMDDADDLGALSNAA